jgi:hypothetical protein
MAKNQWSLLTIVDDLLDNCFKASVMNENRQNKNKFYSVLEVFMERTIVEFVERTLS